MYHRLRMLYPWPAEHDDAPHLYKCRAFSAAAWSKSSAAGCKSVLSSATVFTRNDAAASINFTAVEGGDNSSYAGSEARKVFINTSSDISGVNK